MPYAPELDEQDCEHGLSAALCAGPGHYPDDDRSHYPAATMSDAHSEWHRNAGVPMGVPGCPQDACHPPDDWDGTIEDLTPTPPEAWNPVTHPWAAPIWPDEDEPPF